MTGVDQVAKVRALLAKAESAAKLGNTAEAAAYNAKAAEKMARYGIDAAIMMAKNEGLPDPRVDKVMTFRAPQAKAQGYLYAKVLGAMRIRPILLDSYKTVHVFGYASDMDLAEMMHASLAIQVQRELVHAPLRPANQRGADVRSFIYRYTDVVAARLRGIYAQTAAAAQDELEAGQPSVALVLADRSALVEADVAKEYPSLRTIRVSTSGRAGRAGAEAGRRADLGLDRRVGAGGGRALPR